MKKQKNNISEQQLLDELGHINQYAVDKQNKLSKKAKNMLSNAYYAAIAMRHLYWVQNSVMSEAYNFNAFTSTLVPNNIVDLTPIYKEKPPTDARFCIHYHTKKQKVLHLDDVISLIKQIELKINKWNGDKFAKFMYA